MSDQADKAAELIVADLEKLYGSMYSGQVRKEWVDKYAALIRSAVTAPELVELCQRLVKHWESSPTPLRNDCPECYEIQNAMRSALSSQEPRVCWWTRTNNESNGTWLTGCGKEYFVRTFTRVGYADAPECAQPKYCPDCGGVIKIKES